ncbi:hypothetical protein K0B04_01555 [Patescibacteria group bacterium]|nr:hypothetical protein [Patescibacteria group bacterium]
MFSVLFNNLWSIALSAVLLSVFVAGGYMVAKSLFGHSQLNPWLGLSFIIAALFGTAILLAALNDVRADNVGGSTLWNAVISMFGE